MRWILVAGFGAGEARDTMRGGGRLRGRELYGSLRWEQCESVTFLLLVELTI